MTIFSLAVKDLAELARVVYSLELETLLRIRVIFCDHIDLSRFLNGTTKCNTLSESGHSRTLGKNVLTGAQSLDREGGVLVEIIGKHNGVDIALEHIVVIGKGHKSAVGIILLLDNGKLFGTAIANSGELEPRAFRRAHKGLSSSGTHDSYFNIFTHISKPPVK